MRTLLFASICLFITSCNYYHCSPENFMYELDENKNSFITYDSVSQQNSYLVEDGDGLFFRYSHSGLDCNNIQDDEWGEHINFEIPMNVDSFEYTDDELATANCVYREYGSWVDHTVVRVTEGSISGERQADNSWEITVNVIATRILSQEEVNISFTDIFD